jgi:hypothetical protein
MVDRQVGRDPPCPGTEVAIRAKLVPRVVNAPKSLHGQILGNAWITHNTRSPGVDVTLKLTDQRLERIDLAMREPLEQIHELLYPVLRDMNTQVTSFSVPIRRVVPDDVTQMADLSGSVMVELEENEQSRSRCCVSPARLSLPKAKAESCKTILAYLTS